MQSIELTWSKLIELNHDNINLIGDDVGGVYRISKRAPDNSYYVFYVGRSNDIKERLLEHLSPTEENVGLRNLLSQPADFVFRYSIIQDENIQKSIEKQMYRTYLPEFNNKEPESDIDIEANLN